MTIRERAEVTGFLNSPKQQRKVRSPRRKTASAALTQLQVIIVNFQQWTNTANLVEELRSSDAFRNRWANVSVVDNASFAAPEREQLATWEGVSIRRFKHNLGFARAVNAAAAASQSPWILLLNPDTHVGPGFLDNLQAELETLSADHPNAGVIGFKLRHADGSRQASTGPYPTFFNTLTGLFVPRDRRKCKHHPAKNPAAVPWVTGCCFLIRRDCFNQLDGLDENFFLYYEDVDFCVRARQAGFEVLYNPRLEVLHGNPLHKRHVPAPLRLITRHALLHYADKHWPRWQAILLAGTMLLEVKLRQRKDPEEQGHTQLMELIHSQLRGESVNVRELIQQSARRLVALARRQA